MNRGDTTELSVLTGPTVAATDQDLLAPVRASLQIVWREHRLVLVLAAAYMMMGAVALRWIGQPWDFRWGYGPVWTIWLVVTSLWCLLQYLRHPRKFARIFTFDRVAGAVLTISILAPFQSTFQSLKRAIPSFPWDPFLSRADIALHAGVPWMWWIPGETAMRWIDRLYIAWFPIITLFVIWVSWTSHRQLRSRALLSTLLVWIFAGTVAAWALASAGPCYYGEVVSGSDPYAALSSRITESGLVAGDVQRRLWEWRMTGRIAPLSGVSAMPSMHVAMAVLVAIAVWYRSRALGFVCWVYVGIVQVGSVVLGWHYAIDGYVGAFIVVVCWIISGRLVAPNSAPLTSPTEGRLLVIET